MAFAARRPAAGWLVALATYLLLTAIVFATFVSRAGVLHDDWSFIELFSAFDSRPLLEVATSAVSTNGGDRPVGFFLLGLIYRGFGEHDAAYIVLLALLALAVCVLLFTVLRLVRVPYVPALGMGGLTLLIPVSDAVRLWPAAASGDIALALVLAGLVVALIGTRRDGVAAALTHGLALLLYAMACLTYEAPLAVLPMLFLVYRLRGTWRAALLRGAGDWALTVALIAYISSNTLKGSEPASGLVDRAWLIAVQANQIFASVGTAVGAPVGETRVSGLVARGAALVVVAVAVFAGVRIRRLSSDDPRRAYLLRWVAVAIAGLLVVAAGHAALLTVTGYIPLGAGIDNRVNVVAGVGYVLLTVAVAMMALGLLAGRRLTPRGASIAAGVICLALAATYLPRLLDHKAQFAEAHDLQERVLAVYRADIRKPPPGTRVFSFATPGQTAPGVPVFHATWSLSGALRALWHDRSIQAAPEATMTDLRCLGRAVLPVGVLYDASWRTQYGRALFVDASSGRSEWVADRDACRSWVATRFADERQPGA